MRGDKADFVIYDMVTTITPAFIAKRSRLTLELSRATACQNATATTPTKKRTAEDSQSSPSPKKARRGEAEDGENANKPFCVPSVTEKSGAIVQWKDGLRKFRSVDNLVLQNYETREEAEYAAIHVHDIQATAQAKRFNRQYMAYIGQKRIKHLLTLDPPEEYEDCLGHLQPTQVERPLLGCDMINKGF
ncbi:hypothetical protein ACHAPU_009274 [Fusarium lateritium]